MAGMQTGARLVFEALTAIGARFAVGGSVASSIHGLMRATMDIDILADIDVSWVAEFTGRLAPRFYADADAIVEAIRVHRPFNLIYVESASKIDVFPAHDPFHYIQLDRAIPETSDIFGETLTCPVVTAEDILLAKLVWFRSGGEVSERQWYDVTGIAAVRLPDLDVNYMRKWAVHLGCADLLDRLLSGSDPGTHL